MADEESLQGKAGKTAGDIAQWAGETRALVGEIGDFLDQLEQSDFAIPQESIDRYGEKEEILRRVTGSLEEIKTVMNLVIH